MYLPFRITDYLANVNEYLRSLVMSLYANSEGEVEMQ